MNFTADDKRAWDYLYGKIQNKYGTAGLIGNLRAESGMVACRLQGDYQAGYQTSKNYAARVDSGAMSREEFSNDSKGWGICQWTWHTRKMALYDFAKSRCASIGELDTQLEFLMDELSTKYKSVLNKLKTATSVFQASNAVLFDFESPLVQNEKVQKDRAALGEEYYAKFSANANTGKETTMGYKYYTKGKPVKVSEHFYSTEFDCHGSGCCSQTIINDKLVEYLEMIRTHFNTPVTLTSAYRCDTHNRNVNGATGSRHSKGDAADIVVKGISPRVVAQYAESIGILGIGLYETSKDGYFVHIDTRDYKSFWYGQAQQARTTFGTNSSAGSSDSSASSSSNKDDILMRGDKGDAVRKLQENLNSLGYDCGNVDGIFGSKTVYAVKKFQNDNNLNDDGIVGYQTMAAINKAIATRAKIATVTASVLNVRTGAGTNYKIVGTVRKGYSCEIIEENNGWGKIDKGWICLSYCEIK